MPCLTITIEPISDRLPCVTNECNPVNDLVRIQLLKIKAFLLVIYIVIFLFKEQTQEQKYEHIQ